MGACPNKQLDYNSVFCYNHSIKTNLQGYPIMTQVKINLNNAVDAQTAINAVLSVKLKLEKIVAAMQHTDTVLDHKYLMNYIVGNVGNSIMVSTFDMMEECSNLTTRLAAAGVIELHSEDAYAEVAHATLDYMIDEKMKDDTLVIKGSKFVTKSKKTARTTSLGNIFQIPFKSLSRNLKSPKKIVRIIVNANFVTQ